MTHLYFILGVRNISILKLSDDLDTAPVLRHEDWRRLIRFPMYRKINSYSSFLAGMHPWAIDPANHANRKPVRVTK